MGKCVDARLYRCCSFAQVKKIKAEKERAQHGLAGAVGVILFLLLVLVVVWIHYSRRLALRSTKEIAREPYMAPTLRAMSVAEMDEEERSLLLTMALRSWLEEEKRFSQPDKYTVDEAALALQTNRTYLRKAVKTATGKTMLEYLRDIQLEEACRLLEGEEDLKVEAIAFECGMTRTTFFTLFKLKYKVSPMRYREMVKLIQVAKQQQEGLSTVDVHNRLS
jgi:AraC-like DNA-binding protein